MSALASINRVRRDITLRELRDLVGDARVIMEVGANDGTDSVALARLFPNAMIYCFEVDPRAISKFQKRVTDPRIRLFEIALDDQIGRRTFYQSDGRGREENWDKSGSLRRPTGHLIRSPEITFDQSITVSTTTLDDWAAALSPDLIWCDTQGNERAVFSAGVETLKRTRWVKAECHEQVLYDGAWTEAEMLEFFDGWTCLGRWADDLLFRNDSLV